MILNTILCPTYHQIYPICRIEKLLWDQWVGVRNSPKRKPGSVKSIGFWVSTHQVKLNFGGF